MSTRRRFMVHAALALGLAQTPVIVRALTPLSKTFAFAKEKVVGGNVSGGPLILRLSPAHITVEYWPGQDPAEMAAELIRDINDLGRLHAMREFYDGLKQVNST